MRVTAIIVNHNNNDDVIRLVTRIREFDIFDAVVIVDNKSDDASDIRKIAGTCIENGKAENAARSGRRNTEDNTEEEKCVRNKAVLIMAEKNGGYGYGNNLGMRWAYENGMTHAVIANPDTEFTEECVKAVLEAFKENCSETYCRPLGDDDPLGDDGSLGDDDPLGDDGSLGDDDPLGNDGSLGDDGSLGNDGSYSNAIADGVDSPEIVSITDGVDSSEIFKRSEVAAAAPLCVTPSSMFEAPQSGWKLKTWSQELLDRGPVCRRIFRKYINKNNAVIDRLEHGDFRDASANEHAREGVSHYINVDAVLGSFLAVDIQKFLMSGGYDDEVFLYCEENILGQKIKKSGFTVRLVTDQHYIHHHKPGRPGKQAVKNLTASELYYFREYLHVSPFKILISKIFFGIVYLEVCIAGKKRSLG